MITTLRLFCLLLLCLTPSAFAQEYVVGPGDVLDIRVYEEDDLTRVLRISEKGTITFPLIGKVDVAGKDIDAVSEQLTSALKADYLVNPQVTVSVKEFRSQRVEVLGAVKSPGVIYLDSPSDLINVLAQAGGVLEGAGKQVLLTRAASDVFDGDVAPERVDLHSLLDLGKSELNVAVGGGDRVFVPQTNEIYVMGEVNKQGAVPFESELSLLQAITKVGGFKSTAALSRVQIIRVVDGREQILRVDVKQIQNGKGRDVPLLAEDIVTIPKSIF